ncbi:transporter substrate-binding domain-containing protein [Pseudoduganella sp. DS3]|uniref:Transporter substrate-binding domain-containing protein n=1 Tax=Pseudoduganella guangdongensis TaxID=2692179 RepID=A0A6N9HGI6_9BURK|nr:transporter substrate-binding domain-containing protein [Pseudoduganella guangdongensis]MYN02397.1 transporter substrate-binding domain-containing protein [Pseudoduganella guangdongensis]
MPRRALLLMLCGALAGAPAAASTVVKAYNSYGGAPYVEGKRGLAPDLIAYVNRKLEGRYRLQLVNLTRRDLNQLMEAPSGFVGVALFLAPIFIGDVPQKRFHWSPPFLDDSNAIISRLENPVRYDGPASLVGLRFAGIYGNRYTGIDEYVGKGIPRSNAYDAMSNLRRLARGEADFTVMPLSSFRYLRRQMDREKLPVGQLHVGDKPFNQFGRHFVLAPGNSELAQELDRIAAAMPCDREWRRIAQHYHFPLANGCR